MSAETDKPRLVIIVGPTGVGKTEAAVRLASEWRGEIISADSMQVYRSMDIGTAKPTVEERSGIRHHLIDVVDPDEAFNASLFIHQAGIVIGDLKRRGTPIFVVGGTGLYIKALLGGLFSGPGRNDSIRAFYKQELARHGAGYLYGMLKERDARAAAVISMTDAVRVIRALEVLDISGVSIVEKQARHRFEDRRYETIRIGLHLDRHELYRRIEQRTERMLEKGLVDEVRRLLHMGYHEGLKPMQSIGYRHMTRYISGQAASLKEAAEELKRDTRHYAKRQMTWFSADGETAWFTPGDFRSIREKIDRFFGDRS